MTRTEKVIVEAIPKTDLERARRLSEEYLLKLKRPESAEAGSETEKEIHLPENLKVPLLDKFSIEESVTFWNDYFKLPRPFRRRKKSLRNSP